MHWQAKAQAGFLLSASRGLGARPAQKPEAALCAAAAFSAIEAHPQSLPNRTMQGASLPRAQRLAGQAL
ncbi:hypothetical protein CK621_10895 [Vandammella animalimorsus]|uniref:Uncharacterized protein n=1 Tax=Vandammella animalimorsus TaxID=2029117 RepID=A0A2A2AWY9_9BURK|nr:hypothetical protein CK621_10895 [Vandammella animalimorsus]